MSVVKYIRAFNFSGSPLLIKYFNKEHFLNYSSYQILSKDCSKCFGRNFTNSLEYFEICTVTDAYMIVSSAARCGGFRFHDTVGCRCLPN